MKRRLEVELDFITDLSPLELTSKVAPLVRETIDAVKQSLDAEFGVRYFPETRWTRGSFRDRVRLTRTHYRALRLSRVSSDVL